MSFEDPRLQPMAYISRGPRLYEVVALAEYDGVQCVLLQNLQSMHTHPVPIVEAVGHEWKLVRPAPAAIAPDQPPQEAIA